MSGGFTALGDNSYTKNVCFDGKWTSQIADDGDYKIRNLATGTDVLKIDKTTNVITFDPPIGVSGVSNPMNVDLDAFGFSINNTGNVVSNTFTTRVLTDEAPVNKDTALYGESIITGSYNRQPVVGTQEDFNNALTGFPTSLPCMMSNNLYNKAYNGIFGRRTGLTLTPGLANNYFTAGNQAGFQDRLTYDPLNMRYDPAVPNSWTACKFSENLGPMCPGPIGTRSKMIVSIHSHLEGAWASQANANRLKVYARLYDNAGVVKQDYQVSNIEHVGANVVRSDSRYLMGFSPYESIDNGDYMEIWLENDIGSPNNFVVSLFKTFIEVRPSP